MKKVTLFFFSTLIGFIAFKSNAQSPCLDQTFGNAGIATHSYGNDTIKPKSVAIQQDGKIVVASTVVDAQNSDFMLSRYLLNGDIDSSFGIAGIVKTDFGNNDVDKTMKLCIQTDGKILIGGCTKVGAQYNIALLRYSSIGATDNTFGLNGKLSISIDTSNSYLQDFIVKDNGKIIAAGISTNTLYDDLLSWHLVYNQIPSYLIQLNSDGSFDSTFGNMGIISTNFVNKFAPKKIALQADNKIVLAGFSQNSNGTDHRIVRFDSVGNIDTSFGGVGYIILNISHSEYPRELIIQPDGKLILQGSSGNNGAYPLLSTRFFTNGTSDPSFFYYGFSAFNGVEFGLGYSQCSSILMPNGYIANLGESSVSYNGVGYSRLAMLPFNTNGNIDSAGCSNGLFVIVDSLLIKYKHADAALQTDGKIIQLGSRGFNSITIVRYENSIVNSVNESIKKTENKVLIYPNPASSFITIINGIGKVNIIDLTGKSVLQKQVLNDSETIDISALAQGCYFVISSSSHRVSSFKLIKQ
jgi:uncharacterized delta-60 repeat protein